MEKHEKLPDYVPLECGNNYVGHKWSEIPPKEGFATWCIRCHVLHPRFGFDYTPKTTGPGK